MVGCVSPLPDKISTQQPLQDSETGFLLAPAGTTMNIAAAIPIGVFAGLPNLNATASNLATDFDLSSTVLGHNNFWWENREFPASTITYVRGVHAAIFGSHVQPFQRARERLLLLYWPF